MKRPLISPELHFLMVKADANPFADTYKSEWYKKKESSVSKKEQDIIDFLHFCNREFIKHTDLILKSIDELCLNRDELFDFIYCQANNKTLLAIPELTRQMFPSLIITVEDTEFAKYRDKMGNEHSISSIVEVAADITAYLQSLIEKLNFQDGKEHKTSKIDKHSLYDRMWFSAMHILNLEYLYDQIIYENAAVKWSKDSKKAKIIPGLKEIELIRRCGEIRKDKTIQECVIFLHSRYLQKKVKKNRLKELEVYDGALRPSIENAFQSEDDFLYDASYIGKYYFYSGIKFDFYKGLTLLDINGILKAIVQLPRKCLNEGRKSLITNKIPYKISEEIFLNYLAGITSLKVVQIKLVLDAITSQENRPFPWRKPFIKHNGYYYFTLSALNSPNNTLIFEEVLRYAGYGVAENELLLRDTIRYELLKTKKGYAFEEIDTIELVASDILSQRHLLYKLRDYYVLIEPVYFEHPVISIDLNKVLSNLAERVIDFNKYIDRLIKEFKNEKIIPLIASHHMCLSSLSMDNVHIVDIQMLANYFTKGSFGRAQVIMEGNKIHHANEFATVQYYRDENDFNQNFLQFINFPPQISSIYSKLVWKEIPMSFKGSVPEIITESIDLVETESTVASEIRIVKTMLENKKYLDFEKKRFTITDEAIAYYINNILHTIAFNEYSITLYRTELYSILSQSNFEGFAHMILFLQKALSNISFAKIRPDKKFKGLSYQSDEILEILKKIISEYPSGISFDLCIPEGNLTKQEEKKIVSSAIDVLSLMTVNELDDSQLDTLHFQIIILNALRRKYNLDFEFTQACSNYVSLLNFNRKFQRARNFAESVLAIAIPEKKHYMGWSLLYKCFTEQENPYYASIYGTLYNISLTVFTETKYYVAVDLLTLSLKYFRTFHLYDMMDTLMESREMFKLNKYDDQKIALVYFQANMIRVDRHTSAIDDALQYLQKHRESIKKYGSLAIVPWLNYLYNIKRIHSEGFEGFDKEIDVIILDLEKEISEEKYQVLKKKHFDTVDLKNDFIKSLNGAFETYDSDDFQFEIKQLEMSAKRLLSNSIIDNDVEGILLCSLVLNDNSANYNNEYPKDSYKISSVIDPGQEIIYKLSAYKDYIINSIKLEKDELFIWLFNINDRIYILTINHEATVNTRELPDWDWLKMTDWLKNKDSFYYKGHLYSSLGEQEEHYEKLLDALSFTELSLTQNYKEIFYCSSIDLVQFPTNLIENNLDFISSRVPVTNIISFEYLINSNRNSLLSPKYSSTAWIPIVDQDGSLLVSYDKIKPILQKMGAKIITQRQITEKINTDVNIFLAHGELNLRSFKGIYTNHKAESAIRHTDYLFGSGRVAILFICNSGVANDDILSNSILSLSHDILKLGYETVIAPFWKLEISITPYWLENFLSAFNEGYKVSEAVYLANASLAEYKEDISNSFFVAEGRLDMHIYGNPYLRIKL
ncbi:hypothetical protein MH928_13540 [Flavobacterium sp. WW92]|uniref:hypothetical protein n=1 Tax=unclassified Flavobacterium TaxID=196869 RepID=UPI0022255478|nr:MULTISPECIES: hypothetical protein [unclassified Flavobacterium]WDO12343.1 hypothetical protein MH928_13540 [Flavobacterium sp. WW92]